MLEEIKYAGFTENLREQSIAQLKFEVFKKLDFWLCFRNPVKEIREELDSQLFGAVIAARPYYRSSKWISLA